MRTITEPTNARSRRTRAALLGSARTILEQQGFEALTIAAVADHAGVTRRSVYLHFGTRGELVGALFDYAAKTENLNKSLRPVWQAPDSVTALDEWARHMARYHPRLLSIDRAVERARGLDADAAAHRARVADEKHKNCRRLAERLANEDKLADSWSVASAADMLYALVSSDMIEALLLDRRWSRKRLAEHLARLLRSTFVSERHPGIRSGA